MKRGFFLFLGIVLVLLIGTHPLYAYDWNTNWDNPESGSASVSDDPAPKVISDQEYRVGIGDLLQIEVYDEEDLTREVRVLTDGMISFPLLGSITAAGLTVQELEQSLTKKLGEKYLVNPQVTVFVKEFSQVFVFGEVQSPGAFPIYGRMTVFEAITLAGGFTEVANASSVKIIRTTGRGEEAFEVDINRLAKKGDTTQDIELQANDRVIVKRGFF
ncbi:MAG: polysaccharide biosynthesis/export family protein [Candidatus Omnitrophica bacterium]|nr:polysaccharide biosynthesis/export family protein [Candidatus Omnitrophota bacterium]